MPNIELALIICEPGEDRQRIVASALKCGLGPICCSNLKEARTLLPQEEFRLVFCKDILTDGDFRMVLREVKKSVAHPPVIVLSHSSDWDSYLKALGAGALDFIVCPPNPVEAEAIIWSALADTIGSEKIFHAAA
ncbi:MAG: response regulator [Acidobacteriia bacterium]|nr:response regulator [Terriglobia bacterium]